MQQGNPKVLIIAKPAHGDILLATPLIHSIREKHPDAIIDLIVYPGQEEIVAGSPDINTVLSIDRHASIRMLWSLIRKSWRKYDIAISNGSDDRAHFYLWLFGKKRVSVNLPHSAVWKRWITHATFQNKGGTHALLRNNALGNMLGYKSGYKIIPPRIDVRANEKSLLFRNINRGEPYAVLQLDAGLPYKRWTVDGWCGVAQFLSNKRIKVFLTGGGGEKEKKYLNEIVRTMPASAVNLSGKLRFAETSELIASCSVYVGIDTVNTHIAAAHGVPTVALFGPQNPVCWGPWPAGHVSETSPWKRNGSQRFGNVMIVQAKVECETCLSQNCLKARNHGTGCPLMTGITSNQVTNAITTMLPESGRAF